MHMNTSSTPATVNIVARARSAAYAIQLSGWVTIPCQTLGAPAQRSCALSIFGDRNASWKANPEKRILPLSPALRPLLPPPPLPRLPPSNPCHSPAPSLLSAIAGRYVFLDLLPGGVSGQNVGDHTQHRMHMSWRVFFQAALERGAKAVSARAS
eukprot:9473302-Pyramimonas_sp.AAC.2